ncbi:hypothetical protein DW322_03550 [Rhodococcus rhodnii]|uniref:YfhO family protein n=1 Tax=Rhodococcus rhodnii TaxID=38312 RepID=A0A6P2CJ82_9NOCA|nr:hypothetical protein DW322_03550 [Rhodococcus rhodnii]
MQVTSQTARSRQARYLWGGAIAVVVAVTFAGLRAVNPQFFYTEDTSSGAVGNWLQLGRMMREGDWFPTLVPHQWMAGNYPLEGQGGLFNPPQMLVNWIAPSVDDLSLLSALVKLVFSIVLAWGTYRVALEYGARPPWAAVAGAAAPFVGFSLFFDQPSWVTALTGAAWLMQAWASAVRYARGRSGPVPMFVFLVFAMTVGYVHTALLAGVTILCVVVGEIVVSRSWWPGLRVAIAAGAAAACSAITFLPGALSSDVTWRMDSGVSNDNFLTAPWSETFTASIPSAVSAIESWSGETTPAPITYIAWFAVPALAFVSWRAVSRSIRSFTTPLLLLGALLLFTAGPSAIGPLRWPARVLPTVAVVSLVLLVVLLSRFGTTKPLRGRLVAAGLLVLVQVLRAGSSGPELFGRHVLWGLAIVAVGAALVFAARRAGAVPVAVVLLITTAPIAWYQAANYSYPDDAWLLPTHQSEARDGFPDWEGTTVQLGDRQQLAPFDGRDDPDWPWHSQVYGNYAKILDRDYVNAYTPVGHERFGVLLCMQYDGSTCPGGFDGLFRVEPYTGLTNADLMRVDRVVLQDELFPDIDVLPIPPGWEFVEPPAVTGGLVHVLERTDERLSDLPGTVSATVDATATSTESSANSEHVRVSAPDGGSVVFSRLAWPGYTATLDGEPVEVVGLDDLYVMVDLPPGTVDADLALSFRPPGWRLGTASAAGGVLVLAVLTAVHHGARLPRRRSRETPETTAPSDAK